jgi:hypothetical protein
MGEAARDLGGELAEIGDELVESALLDDDASGNETLRPEGGEGLLERLAPAEGLDQG